jgi:hypothetical protein
MRGEADMLQDGYFIHEDHSFVFQSSSRHTEFSKFNMTNSVPYDFKVIRQWRTHVFEGFQEIDSDRHVPN